MKLNHIADHATIAAARKAGTKVTFDCGLSGKPRAVHARRPVCLKCAQAALTELNGLRRAPRNGWTWTAGSNASTWIWRTGS